MNEYSNNITKQAIKDACNSYERFFNKYSGFPKFKSKKKTKPSFYQDGLRMQATYTHVKLEKLASTKKKNRSKFNWIKLAEKNSNPSNCKYYNPRITFDGLNWWISVGVENKCCQDVSTNDGMGIDLGIKDLAICSDGHIYKNINKTSKIKQLEKTKRRVQRSISRKYLKNKKEGRYCKTNNIIKSEIKLRKLHKRLKGVRKNYLHQTTSEIIKRKPSYIVLEDLNISGMMKNKHLSKAVQQQWFYKFRRQIEYKSMWNNIEFVIADRYYPSSKKCSKCGNIKSDLKLSDRTYICKCGNVMDRDMNAAINLMNYYKLTI